MKKGNKFEDTGALLNEEIIKSWAICLGNIDSPYLVTILRYHNVL